MSSDAGVLVLVVAATAAAVFGVWRWYTDGKARVVHTGARIPGLPVTRAVTLVQFSSDYCSPCVTTRRLLTEVATQKAVEHIDLRVDDHMDLVDRLDIHRTPTILVLDPGGAVRRRIVGVPRTTELEAAIDELARTETS